MGSTSHEEEKESVIKDAWEYKSFAKFYFLLQIIFIILFGTLADYGETARGVHGNATYNVGDGAQLSNFQYIKFQVITIAQWDEIIPEWRVHFIVKYAFFLS